MDDPFGGALSVEQTISFLWKHLVGHTRDYKRRPWDFDRGAAHGYAVALSCLTDHALKQIIEAADQAAEDRSDPLGLAA